MAGVRVRGTADADTLEKLLRRRNSGWAGCSPVIQDTAHGPSSTVCVLSTGWNFMVLLSDLGAKNRMVIVAEEGIVFTTWRDENHVYNM